MLPGPRNDSNSTYSNTPYDWNLLQFLKLLDLAAATIASRYEARPMLTVKPKQLILPLFVKLINRNMQTRLNLVFF
jgi:hypothetical protein